VSPVVPSGPLQGCYVVQFYPDCIGNITANGPVLI
jgi:hypothetical protein